MLLLSSHVCIQFLIKSLLSHVHMNVTFFFSFFLNQAWYNPLLIFGEVILATEEKIQRSSGPYLSSTRMTVTPLSPCSVCGTAATIHRLQLLPEPWPSLALKINYCMRGWVHYFCWIRLKCLKRTSCAGTWLREVGKTECQYRPLCYEPCSHSLVVVFALTSS